MENVSVILKTGEHCIQGAAKSEFRRITMMILESTGDEISPVLAEQIELLTDFLEKSDFGELRSSDERLAGTVEAVCILRRGTDGNTVIMFNDKD
jgi:hypothetical protein